MLISFNFNFNFNLRISSFKANSPPHAHYVSISQGIVRIRDLFVFIQRDHVPHEEDYFMSIIFLTCVKVCPG